jgi:putative FmdB family regulatory protein
MLARARGLQEPGLTATARAHRIAPVSPRRFAVPIYEFKCEKCGSDFEELVFGAAEDVECPRCKSTSVERKMSTFAFKSGGKFVAASSGSGCSSCQTTS